MAAVEEPTMPPAAPGPLSYAEVVLQTPPESPKEFEYFNGTDSHSDNRRNSGEFVGRGLNESPTSLGRGYGHRKTGSRSSPPAQHRRKRRQGSQGSSISASSSSDSIVFEKYTDGKGGKLASVIPSEDYEESLRQARIEDERSDQKQKAQEIEDTGLQRLVSGRQAAAGWEKSSIRWAPLNVPLKRRLQTLAVLGHTLSAFLLLSSFFFTCAIPLFWPIIVPYLIYVLLSKAGTNGNLRWRSDRVRKHKVWSLFASYFPARLHRTEELPPTRKYIFGYHPHGIISHGAFAAFGTEALGFSQLFPGITNTLLTLDSNFRVPFYREYILSLGLQSVSRESCENLLSKGGTNGEGMGRGITIVVGGARESLETHPGTFRLILGRRKGFVKMAIREGADLVPVLAFGENDIYEQLSAETHPRLHKLQLMAKKVMGFTVPVFHARGIFNYDVGMMPYRKPMNIVVGRAIKIIQQKGKPDEAYVDEVHARYVKELQLIWDTWKDTFAPERKGEMEIVE